MQKKSGRCDAYRFPGFRPDVRSKGIFADPVAQVVIVKTASKKGEVGQFGTSYQAYYGHKTQSIQDIP